MSDRIGVLGQIKSPLIFFALALLIIEGFLLAVLGLTDFNETLQFILILLMFIAFIAIVACVTFLTVKYPTHLNDKLSKELSELNDVKEFVESPAFKELIDQQVMQILNKEGEVDE